MSAQWPPPRWRGARPGPHKHVGLEEPLLPGFRNAARPSGHLNCPPANFMDPRRPLVVRSGHARTWPVRLMCRVLGVSPSGFYGWRSRPESARSASNRQLLDDVRRIHAAHHRRYGAPRVHAALRSEGRSVSRGQVERLVRQHGIRALAGRRFRPCTTDSRHDLPIAPNLLKRDFSAARPNTIWLAEPKVRGATSPTCRPARAGCTWPLSSIWPRARSSAGRCASICAPS